MITVGEIVEDMVRKSPFIEEGMTRGIINLSALAREIKPKVEEKLMKDVQEGAIVMALKRLSPDVKNRFSRIKEVTSQFGDITVKSNLVDFTFANSPTFFECVEMLLKKMQQSGKGYFTVTQGVTEATVIISSAYKDVVEKLFKGEKLLLFQENLSSVTVGLMPENIRIPGVYYQILKMLAWENINLVDAVSTSNEITCIFSDNEVDKAFSILKSMGDN